MEPIVGCGHLKINDLEKIGEIINKLKTNYEDYWKDINQINTSIKLTLTIKAQNLDNSKIMNFEKERINSTYSRYLKKQKP